MLATRGKPRGAEDVLGAAIATVESEDGNGRAKRAPSSTVARDDLEPLVPDPLDEPPVVNLQVVDLRRRRRSWRTGLTAGGLAAMLGVMSLGIASLLGGSGSSSPEGAVRQLADAISHEDPLAAVDVLAPDEVRSLAASVDFASARAAEVELVETAGAPLAGLNVDVQDLELSSEQLAPGFAKVSLRGGRVGLGGDVTQLSESVRRMVPEIRNSSFDLGGWRPVAVEPFVMVVEHDDAWYVSPAYTAFEYLRVANDLPEADFGSGREAASSLGAATPETAARTALEAIASADWPALLTLAAPDELPVYDYRAALTKLLTEHVRPEFAIATFEAKVELNGSSAFVDVTASGGASSSSEPGNDGSWELRDGCIVTTLSSTFDEDGVESTDAYPSAMCVQTRGVLPFAVWSEPGDGPTRITAVERDGRWFLSPMGTALDYLDQWIASVDERTVASFFGDATELEPDGRIALNQPFTVPNAGPGVFAVYEFEGRAKEQVLAQIDSRSGRPIPHTAYVLGPANDMVDEGYGISEGFPATLRADGTYRLVVQAWTQGPFSVTLWDVAAAPPALREQQGDVASNEACDPSRGFAAVCRSLAASDGSATSATGHGGP
jgi:hypothetical protein